ncbi:MAG: radical SAM protein [Sedimentisphaerales bacterium]|nr:radical SAM protein [Sedimentisphaerales bacterium]
MLTSFSVGGKTLDSLDLKILLVTKGIKVDYAVYERFCGTRRLNPDPLTCNCLILPDGTIVHITDVAMHMSYLKNAISLESLRNIRYALHIRTPFRLVVSHGGSAVLLHNGEQVTEVSFPPASRFYEQKTSGGLPYLGNAVLQGRDFLSFQCLWPCDYAKAGYPCQFCYSGGVYERLARKRKPDPPVPTPQDVAEITDYAVNKERTAKHIQLTGGSTMNPQAECHIIRKILAQIDSLVGLQNIPGEVLVYTTPPSDPETVDQVFEAGASRIACSLEVWSEDLARTITPGKWKFSGRERCLNCLKYIARKYGPNKACSSFVVGIEPAESYLEGAEYLARDGIVPIASIWIPFGRPVMGRIAVPGLDYYRKVKEGLAEIYAKYGIVPPGSTGLNVCLCRDIWNHRSEITACCPHGPAKVSNGPA